MADLLDSDRAKKNILTQTTFTTPESATIDALVPAVSQAIRRFCRRNFDLRTYDELYNGTNSDALCLDQYPVTAISRLCTGSNTVLKIRNTSTSVQRATAAITPTTLSLIRVASGVSTTTTITLGSYATLALLAVAVNAVGSGWEATVISGYDNWATADLRAQQGALPASQSTYAEFRIHIEDVANYEIDPDRGILYRRGGQPTADEAFRLSSPIWCPGILNYRVVYSAGYATIPEDVQQAAADWIQQLYFQCKRDGGLVQAQTVHVGNIISLVNREPIPKAVLGILQHYRRYSWGRM